MATVATVSADPSDEVWFAADITELHSSLSTAVEQSYPAKYN